MPFAMYTYLPKLPHTLMPQYLTGQKSEGGNHDSSADYSKNPNLFTITTIAAGDWIIGDPSHIVNGKVETKNDELQKQIALGNNSLVIYS